MNYSLRGLQSSPMRLAWSSSVARDREKDEKKPCANKLLHARRPCFRICSAGVSENSPINSEIPHDERRNGILEKNIFCRSLRSHDFPRGYIVLNVPGVLAQLVSGWFAVS